MSHNFVRDQSVADTFFSLTNSLRDTQSEFSSRGREIAQWINLLLTFYSYSGGIDFRRQNLTSTDVRFWRLKLSLSVSFKYLVV